MVLSVYNYARIPTHIWDEENGMCQKHVPHPSPLDIPLSMHALIMQKSPYHHSVLPVGALSFYWTMTYLTNLTNICSGAVHAGNPVHHTVDWFWGYLILRLHQLSAKCHCWFEVHLDTNCRKNPLNRIWLDVPPCRESNICSGADHAGNPVHHTVEWFWGYLILRLHRLFCYCFGMAMGLPVSVIVANPVMEEIEEKALSIFSPSPQFWKRYVDDICTVLHADLVYHFLDHLSSIDPHIQLILEIEKDSCLPFWIFFSHRDLDGDIWTSIIQKHMHTGRYLHFSSPSS